MMIEGRISRASFSEFTDIHTEGLAAVPSREVSRNVSKGRGGGSPGPSDRDSDHCRGQNGRISDVAIADMDLIQIITDLTIIADVGPVRCHDH
jgi:hypothetical protein